MSELTDAKRRIIEALKRVESATAQQLATEFNTTTTAVRQHLEALETAQLVERVESAGKGRGRPALHWKLALLSLELFPDKHGELTVELIGSVRTVLGDDALEQIVRHRASTQIAAYSRVITQDDLASRVRELAAQRTAEGYLAEVVTQQNDLLLIEHHCPICVAASTCQSLCRSELEVFQTALGPTATVTRIQHLLSGDTRCTYRISPADTPVDAGEVTSG